MEVQQRNGEQGDRLSALPDALIHHIFSYLDMSDVVPTSILSNRWRYLWLSTDHLTFDLSKWMKRGGWPNQYSGEYREKMDAFVEFVDKVMSVGGSSSIVKFHVFSYDDYFDPTRILAWIIVALERHVGHLHLDLPVCQPLELPHQLCTSNVEVLNLHITETPSPVRLPKSICRAARIKDLQLHNVIFPEGNANGELILSCPSLKTLKISHGDVNHLKMLTISTPLLESLELLNLDTGDITTCMVKICTPNLNSLGILTEYHSGLEYSLETLSSLASACIIEHGEPDIWCFHGSYASKKNPRSEFYINVLHGIYNVRALTLSVTCVKVLTYLPNLLEKLPELLRNLNYVMLVEHGGATCVPAMLNFLERCPHIDTFVWQIFPYKSPTRSNAEEEEWVANLRFQSIFSCLKTFEIHYFQGTEIEMRFLELLLERATHLKEIIIKAWRSLLSDEKLREINEKLVSLPRASKNASVTFQFEER